MKVKKATPPAMAPESAPPETASTTPDEHIGDVLEGVSVDRSESQNMASLATRSTATAAFTVKEYSMVGADTDGYDIADALQQAGAEVVGGDLCRVEKMLINQAIVLDNIFNNMAMRSAKQETYKGIEVFMRLALKAQAQSRATAEALAEIKNPRPVTFVKQANMSQGHQQVNNSYAGGLGQRAEDSQIEQTKLLEADHGQRLDIGAQAAPGRVDQAVETVAAVHRANVTGG